MASRIVKPCPVKDGNTKCGETETLAIIQEFKTLYESKMNKIDSAAGGDNLPVLQAKVRLQKQWIRDLTAQNELLVRAVEELEREATEKVTILEQKIRSGGMQGTDVALDSSDLPKDQQTLEAENLLQQREAEMKEKDAQLGHVCKQLQDKTEEVKAVRRSLLDMRSALTIEVAEKHDVILSLRRDVQEFEEKCRQSNKQTQFKDDIIKELRKEIKALREEIVSTHVSNIPPSPISPDLPSSPSNFHQCCPYVRDLCPLLNLKPKRTISKKLNKLMLAKNKQETFNNDNQAIIFMREEGPTHDYTNNCGRISQGAESGSVTEYRGLSATVIYSAEQNKNKNDGFVCEVPKCVSVSRNSSHQTNKRNHRKTRSKLTASKILHEYYGIKDVGDKFGTIESFKDFSDRKVINIPNHVSVKTFITNLEGTLNSSREKQKDNN